MKRLFVLTGGPCSGKTTLLKELRKAGFHTIPEAARKVVEEHNISPQEFHKVENRKKFQLLILQKQLEYESKVPKGAVAFLDRGIPDDIAYMRAAGHAVPEDILKAASNRPYEKVFLLEVLRESYEQDNIRKEALEEALVLEEMLLNVYEGLGYTIIKVPEMPIKRRLEAILENIS